MEENTISVITKITYLLFLYLVLAIFVERAVEVIMSVIKYIDLKAKGYRTWNSKAKKFNQRLGRLNQVQGKNTADKKRLFRWIMWNLITEKPYEGGKEVIAAKSIRTRYFRYLSRAFGFLVALGFAIWFYNVFEVDLVLLLKKVGDIKITLGIESSPAIKILITAAILAAGSEPLHRLIKKVEYIGQTKKAKQS